MVALAMAKVDAREALLQAAFALIPERGLDVSLDALCAHAGYTRGAFYQHFENRDALIAEVTARMAHDLLEVVVQQFSGESVGDLVSVAHTAIGLMQRGEYPIGRGGLMRSWQLLQACERSAVVKEQYLGVFEKTRSTFASLIRRAQAEGKLPDRLHPESLATLGIAMVVGLRTLHDVGAPMDLHALLPVF